MAFPRVDLLLCNACIYTLDPLRPTATHLAIQGGRLLAVGGEELDGLMSCADTVLDAEQAIVLPGLVDAHLHWEWTSRNRQRVVLLDLPTKQAAVEAVAEAVRRTKPGQWVVGFGWAQGPWSDSGGAFPCAADLDAIAPENPVYLSARSGHASWSNSLALKAAGITASTQDPPGGSIQRDGKGNPTGILFEDASLLISSVIPPQKIEETMALMLEEQEQAWRWGLTGVHDYDGPSSFAAEQALHQDGKLGLRIVKQINDPYIHHAHALGLRSGLGDDMLKLGALKIFADGALGSLTALMIEPYAEQPDNFGMRVTGKEAMRELVLEATRRGFPSTIHAIGDLAVRDVLDVYTEARALETSLGIPRDRRRHRIEHVQVIHPDDVGRLAALDVIASIQPIHATSDYPVADRYWGSRAALSYNARVQLDHGARVAFGSDAPVESHNPFLGIHAAVTRRRPDGSPGPEGWYPDARLTLEEALLGYTVGPAYAAMAEDRLGKLAAGYLADLILVDRDPFAIDPHELKDVTVLGTMVGGEWKWRAQA